MNTLKIEAKLAEKYGYEPLEAELSKKYRQFFRDNLPDFIDENGSTEPIYTLNGTLICNGYDRVVIGDYGAFIEFNKTQANSDTYIVKPGEEYRINDKNYSKNVKYHWYTVNDGSDIKIYLQKKKVTYADYKTGRFYISPHEVKVLTKPQNKKDWTGNKKQHLLRLVQAIIQTTKEQNMIIMLQNRLQPIYFLMKSILTEQSGKTHAAKVIYQSQWQREVMK